MPSRLLAVAQQSPWAEVEVRKQLIVLMLLVVGVGGALGSVARFLVSVWVQRRSHAWFPWSTYAVNSTGSFLIGLVFALFDSGAYSSEVLTLLVAGILGGYTTFSAFSVENMKLFHYRQIGSLLHNTFGQVIGGLLLAAAGYWLGSVAL